MAAFNHVRDLNDVALKPRLLRNLIKDYLPSETLPFSNPTVIATVVSSLKTHQLLSETSSSIEPKLVSSWKSAIDAWIDHVLLLARSDSPDKCWAGVSLLGVTCTGCSSDRFLSSFSDWFNVLVSHIQQSGVSAIVRVASCAAASDLLTRLGGFSNIKKDGISCAGKLVQPILKTLTGDASEEMLEIVAELLCTVLSHFPSALQRHYDNAEAAIVSKIMSGNCNSILLKKFACCLASLPKSKGDEVSWSLMMQKVLLSLSSLLDSTLEGLEEESRCGKAVALLVPPGKSPPPPLGGQVIKGEAINNGDTSQQSVISIISCLMQCCCTMLTSSYQVQVIVPVRPLLATIERVIMVNGSLPEALQPFTTAMQQELACLHLPVLHQNALEVLAALQKGLHSQVLPHAAEIVWLLTKYFERCWLPELRTKAYAFIRSLLTSMGSGMALYISQVVIDNGLIDLKAANNAPDKERSSEVSVEPSQSYHRKRRKHGSASWPLVAHQVSVHPECKEPQEHQTSISLKIAAVEALEALIIVGGSLRSDSWRSGIDHLLMEVATNACKDHWNHIGKPVALRAYAAPSEDFQLVALRALLASLLSPAGVRPPYLAQGLELFLKGKQNAGTKVAEFCAQALLALEVLIHPRALPLVDTPNNFISGRTDFGDSKYKLPSLNSNVHGIYPDVYDVLDYVNMEDGFGYEAVDNCKDREPNAVDGSSDKATPEERVEGVKPASVDEKTRENEDQVMSDVPADGTLMGRGDPPSPRNVGPEPMNDVSAPEIESAVINKTFDVSQKRKLEDDDDDSSDSFPDIVDADPDTDSDSDS